MNNDIPQLDVLYILMRTDLPSMNAGKAMAQASHASNQFIHHITNNMGSGLNQLRERVTAWQSQTKGGFGTVLVLGTTMEGIYDVEESLAGYLDNSPEYKWLYGRVTDPTYPYIVNHEIKDLIDEDVHTQEPRQLESGDFLCLRSEVTCSYLFLDKNSDLALNVLGDLSLHA